MWRPLLVLVAAGACRSSPPPTPTTNPAKPATPHWHEGIGVDGCALGANQATCRAALGEPVPDEHDVQLGMYPALGIEFFADGDIVEHVYVRYRYPGITAFAGTDEHGIGATSSFEEVVKQYGPPTTEENLDEAGVTIHRTTYDHRGLQFMFVDGMLAGVGIARIPSP